jgi:hypothetical protein
MDEEIPPAGSAALLDRGVGRHSHRATRPAPSSRALRWWLRAVVLLHLGLIASVLAGMTAESGQSALGRQASTQPGQSIADLPIPQDINPPIDTPESSTPPMLSVGAQHFVDVRGTPGFWRVGRTDQNVWWFLSPRNEPEFLNTVTTVQPFQTGRLATGPQFISSDWNGSFDTATGDLSDWATKTLTRVRSAGFKGLGAWCNPVFHQLDVPMTRDLNLWAHAHGADARLYSPNWRVIIEEAIARQVEPLRDNPNLVGYYTDNELDWSDAGAGPAAYFDNLAADDPNKNKVISVIQTQWPDVASFNAAWNLNIETWEELRWIATLPHQPAEAYGKLLDAWVEQLATDYFATTTELLRKYDPNHLILGVRFKGNAPKEVVRAQRGRTDAVSINYYPSDAKLDADMFPMVTREADQPIIITEYSFHSLDGRSGNRNTFGFSAQVLDQQARADGYKLFTQRLARVPYIIGADWFQWMDEPPSGRTMDGEDVNFGIVDVDDRPYELLVDAIRETTPTLNPLHAQSPTDLGTDIARQKFSEQVRVDVPYLDRPIKLNGELSDWPDDTRLSGIRHSQTLGLDRSNLPLPNIRLAWNERGLYFGAEVFDRDIEGAPADGWWWTRDAIEFFISTRTPQPEQNFYTPNEHQFFFVPISFPGPDGSTGTVGRWRRPGDGLQASRVPDPLVKQASRIFPDRYVLELFIPAEALNQFDPTGQTPMALNVHVRNFQNAIEYFWSAPKQVQTHLRPGTWGSMLLAPKTTAAPNVAASP